MISEKRFPLANPAHDGWSDEPFALNVPEAPDVISFELKKLPPDQEAHYQNAIQQARSLQDIFSILQKIYDSGYYVANDALPFESAADLIHLIQDAYAATVNEVRNRLNNDEVSVDEIENILANQKDEEERVTQEGVPTHLGLLQAVARLVEQDNSTRR